MTSSNFSGVVDAIEESTEGLKTLSFDDIVTALNHRGFGALLIPPTLIVLLPTGAIPGVPALCGIFICLIAIQIIVGRRDPWMPEFLKRFSVKSKRIVSALKRIKPYARWVDRYVQPRFSFLTHDIFQRLIALLCVGLALMMTIVGFVPFLPSLLALPILFFAMGLSAKDGIMTFMGLAFTLGAICVIGYLLTREDRALDLAYPVFGRLPSFYIEFE